jgi:guanylate kinase
LRREREQLEPKYAELCRRFLSDENDFSYEKLRDCGIRKRYNNIDFDDCVGSIITDIKSYE